MAFFFILEKTVLKQVDFSCEFCDHYFAEHLFFFMASFISVGFPYLTIVTARSVCIARTKVYKEIKLKKKGKDKVTYQVNYTQF